MKMKNDMDDFSRQEPKEVKDNGISSFGLKLKNKPILNNIKDEISFADNIDKGHISNIERALVVLKGEIPKNIKERMNPNKSKMSPKIALEQARAMYPKLSEPFMSSSSLFMTTATNPIAEEYSLQAEILLNYHTRYSINRRFLVDQASKQFYDHGVVFAKVFWTSEEIEEVETVLKEILDSDGNIKEYKHEKVVNKYLSKNLPTVELCPYNSITVDPSCRGDISKAKFVAYKYTTCKADLMKDSKYKNLDLISFDKEVDDVGTVIGDTDEATQFLNSMDTMRFKDESRKMFTVTEYWGMYDVEGNGILEPIVVSYVNDIVIQMNISPMPDKQLPFVSAAFDIEQFSVYGSSNSLLLDEPQQIIGNLTRALVDQVSDRMDRRTIFHPSMFKTARQKDNYIKGIPAESSGTMDPRIGIFESYNDKPIDMNVANVLSLFKGNVSDITGVSMISSTANNFTSSNEVDAYVDSASNRESVILGRFAEFFKQIGNKIISMSLFFMEEEEISSITGKDVVPYPSELPRTISPYNMDVQVMTEGVKRAKIAKLLEVLQFVKDTPDPKVVGSIVRKIALLDDSPDLAQTIYDIITAPPPPPTEQEIMLMELQIQKAMYEVEVLKFTAQDLMATSQLKTSRIGTEESKQELQFAKADDLKNSLSERLSGLDLTRERAQERLKLESEAVRQQLLSDIAVRADAEKKANEAIISASLDPTKRSTI